MDEFVKSAKLITRKTKVNKLDKGNPDVTTLLHIN